jgi:hypothetical protein
MIESVAPKNYSPAMRQRRLLLLSFRPVAARSARPL